MQARQPWKHVSTSSTRAHEHVSTQSRKARFIRLDSKKDVVMRKREI